MRPTLRLLTLLLAWVAFGPPRSALAQTTCTGAAVTTLDYSTVTPTGDRKAATDVATSVSVTTSAYTTATANGQTNTFAVGANGSLAGNGNYLVWQQNYQGVNPATTANTTTVTYTFSRAVNNLKIVVTDIDRDTPNNFIDRLTFDGYATATGGTAITLSTADVAVGNSNQFVGNGSGATGTTTPAAKNNAVTGTSTSAATRTSDVTVTFPSAVTRLVLTYENIAPYTAGTNRTQTAGIASLSWCRATPVANNVITATMPSSAGQVGISPLNATSEGTISSYKILTLPAAGQGILYYNSTGTTYAAATTNLTLTPAQAASLRFDPADGSSGNASFTYSALDNANLTTNTATYTLPINSTTCATATGSLAYTSRPAGESWVNRTTALAVPAGSTVTTVSTSGYTVPASATNNSFMTAAQNGVQTLQWLTDYANTTNNSSSVTFNFNRPVSNFAMQVQDIDKLEDGNANSFIDRVAFTGANGGTAVTPVLGPVNANTSTVTINGSVATGTTNNASAVDASIIAYFPAPVTSITVTYSNVSISQTNPSQNAIGIDLLSFCRQAPVANAITTDSRPSGQGVAPITSLSTASIDGTTQSYTISALPPAAQGVYYVNGVVLNTTNFPGLVLTPTQATQLSFAPAAAFSGNAGFTYIVTDDAGTQSAAVTYTIPVTPTGAAGTAAPCANPGRDGSPTLTTNPNAYYPGTTTATAGSTTIAVGAATGANTNIAVGDLLLVIQMQGADIDASNTDSYGDGVAGGGASGNLTTNFTAGTYEYVVANSAVTAGAGGTITLASALKNNYANANATASTGQRRFQVVRVPQYNTLTLGGNITATPWNGTSGGIVVLDVAGQLNLGGFTIDASGAGFRGGAGRKLNGVGNGTAYTSIDYRTPASAAINGQKGEGTAGTPQYVNNSGTLLNTGTDGYPNGSNGRGAPGNAGGGGTDTNPAANDQNDGGGGGANGGAGGRGGNAWSSNAASGGEPGAAFNAASSSRLVLGGGGGAGVTNDGTGTPGAGFASSGAAGGGLVIVRTGSVSGNGSILANGAAANNTVANDGSGGGGAGGSILVTAANPAGLTNLTLAAVGGTGGTNTGGGVAHGPGGGGGGGVVLTNGSTASASATAGANGTTFGNVAFGAAPGLTGTTNAQISNSIANSTAGANCVADVATTLTTSQTAVLAGASVTYTATVLNNGAATATNVAPTVQLPAGLTPAAFTTLPTGASYDNATGLLTLPTTTSLGTGTANQLTYGITFTAPNYTTTITGVAASTASTPDLTAANNNGTATNAQVQTVVTLPSNGCGGTPYGSTASSGLYAEYYKGYFNDNPGYFAANTPGITRTDGTLNFAATNSWGNLLLPAGNPVATGTVDNPDTYSSRYRGNINIASAGTYTFYITSDDASYMWLDGPALNATPTLTSAVISNGGQHGAQTVQATLTLTAGPHNILVFYGEQAGANTLTFEYSGGPSNLARQIVPNSILCATFVPLADVTTALTGPSTIVAGQPTGTYTASFTNEGPSPASTVSRTVTLPAGATNIVVNGAAYTPTTANTIDFGQVSTLASGVSNAFTFSFTPATTATGSLAITSNVTTATSQGNDVAPNSSTITATVAPVADVATTLVANTTPIAAGTPATATNPAKFTVTFTNNGPATANGVTGTVQLPTGLTNVIISFPNGANGVSGTYNSTTGVVTYSGATSIPSGGTITSGIAFDAPINGPVAATSLISTTTNEAGKQANNTASASIDISPTFDLATTITGPTSAVPGDLVTLAVMTTNNGPSASPNAVQTVSLPQGLTNVYVSNGGVYNGAATAKDITVNGVTYTNVQPGQVVFPTIGSLPNGQSVANSVSFSQPASAYSPIAKLTTSGTGETNTLNNTASLNGVANSTVAVATPAAGTANAYTTISSSVPSTTVGSPITLTVVTGNNGPNAATGVTQTVQLLPGLTGVTISNSGTYNSTTGIVTFPTLASGANGSVSGTSVSNTITFNAPASTGNNGQLLAMAAVSTTNTDPVAADNVASVGVTLVQSADLASTVTGPASAQAGQPVTYTASFVNNGTMTAINAVETVQLPVGLGSNAVTITDGNNNPVTNATYNSTTGLVTFPTLATDLNGAVQVYNLTFAAPSQNLTVRSNVTSATTDANTTNNSSTATTTIAASADLATTVAGPATAVVGSAVTYSVTTTNNGPSTATNAVTTLKLATGFTAATLQVGGQTGTLSGNVITYGSGATASTYDVTTGLVTFPSLATQPSGATTTNYVTFVMPNATGGQTTGVASVSSSITDPTPGNNTASVATSVAPVTTTSADITATVSTTTTSPTPGTAVAFTATYGNNGTDPAVNVVPTLQLATGLTLATLKVAGQTGTLNNGLITFSGSGAVYNTQTGLVTFPTIASQASGAAGNVSYAVNVTAGGNGSVTAVAATTSNTSEPNTAAAQANDVQSASVTITPTFDEVTSLSGPASAPVGSAVTYTATTTNNGPSLTTGITTQTVTLPAGITATNISNGGTQSGTTITWTIPAGQAVGANGAVANTFTITQPTGGATLTATVASPGESNTGNNTAYLNGATVATATTVTNLAPLAYAVVNTLQGPQSSDAGNLPNGLLISPLAASDPENSFATQKYTIVAAPDASQGVLYYNSTGTTYVAVANGQTLTDAQSKTLKFKAATGYVGNASFTYLTTDLAGNMSPTVNYTLPIESDIEAPAYTVLTPKTTAYTTGDVLAYTTDTNGAIYNAATALVYKTDGTLQTGASNGIASAVDGAFTSSRGDVTSLASLGISVDTNGRLVVTNPGTVASPNLKAGNYTVSIATTDANGGFTTQVVSFTIPANPLPVVLTAFTAQAVQNRDALLSWTTATEQNSASFEVERSLDGSAFTKIGQVAAQGTSVSATAYAFTDAGIGVRAQGQVYYRLRQVDLNGAASYSPVRTVSFTKAAAVVLSVYPNPATTSTSLDLSALPASSSYQVLVLDATGRQVLAATQAGGLPQPLDLTSLASGTYQVLVTGKLTDGSALRQVLRLIKE